MAVRLNKVLVALLLLLGLAPVRADELGDIAFPNSGAPAAQAEFLTGVKALQSFQFDEARFAFEAAQKIDPSFALAYWGQAMSDNHPLWAQQDAPAAKKALMRLAPTFGERLAKAPTEKEKGFLTAIERLYYSPGDKLERDTAYSDYMASMHERWPADDEISVFYALSLLGTVRPGDRGFRRQAEAAAICLEIFARKPNNPGAAHYIIHAFDDPDHAILALPAARVYASIAPAAAHALHMPSHIFMQLGMWDRVVSSNIAAYAAATAVNRKYGLPEGREDFHTLSWLAYANLMLGYYDRAEENLSQAAAALERNPGPGRVLNGYLEMKARHMLETGNWQPFELAPEDSPEGQHVYWLTVVGMSAAKRGDARLAAAVEARLQAIGHAAGADGDHYRAAETGILAGEVAALRLQHAGKTKAAIAAAKDAAVQEREYMQAPSGPPKPMKPAGELYAEILLDAGRPGEALTAFERALDRVPQRTPSLLGLARAAELSGDPATAERIYRKLRDMSGANPHGPAVEEAASKSGP